MRFCCFDGVRCENRRLLGINKKRRGLVTKAKSVRGANKGKGYYTLIAIILTASWKKIYSVFTGSPQ